MKEIIERLDVVMNNLEDMMSEEAAKDYQEDWKKLKDYILILENGNHITYID